MGPVAYFGLSDDFFPNDMNSYRGTRMPHEQCIVPGMIRCDDCACLKLVFEIKLMLSTYFGLSDDFFSPKMS